MNHHASCHPFDVEIFIKCRQCGELLPFEIEEHLENIAANSKKIQDILAEHRKINRVE